MEEEIKEILEQFKRDSEASKQASENLKTLLATMKKDQETMQRQINAIIRRMGGELG